MKVHSYLNRLCCYKGKLLQHTALWCTLMMVGDGTVWGFGALFLSQRVVFNFSHALGNDRNFLGLVAGYA